MTAMQDEATYTCDACGEEIVVPVDLPDASPLWTHREEVGI